MKQFLSLVKLEFLNITKLQLLKQTKLKLFGFLFLIIFLIGSVGGSFYQIYESIFIVLQPLGFYIPIIFFYTSLLVLLLTIYSTKSILFEIKEKDLFLSLPLNHKYLFLSRIFIIFGISLGVSSCSLIPALLVYINNLSVDGSFILYFLLVSILIPIIPTVISCILGYFLGWVLNHVKNKSLIENGLYFIFFISYFILSFSINQFIGKIVSNQEVFITILKYGVYPLYLLYKLFLYQEFGVFLGFALINLIILFLFFYFFNKKYLYLLQKYSIVANYKKVKKIKARSNSKKVALLKKEWGRIINTPIYLFQFGFGLILLIIISGASFFIDISNVLNFPMFSRLKICFYLYLFILSLSNFSCVSYSLEKNQFWILKVMPLNEKEIFDSKWQASWLFILPFCLISLICLIISKFLLLKEGLVLFIFTSTLVLFINILGLVINILFPKMENVSDASIVKRSFSSFLAVMIPFLLIIVISLLDTITISTIIYISIGLLILSFIIRKLGLILLKNKKI